MTRTLIFRIVLGMVSAAGLVLIFLFQQFDVAVLAGVDDDPIKHFIFNRTVRFFLNDLLAIGLIFSLFMERKYVIFCVWVQLAGMICFLFPYFILKIYWPHYNGPLISFLHRLILNPTLLLLLIPAFYYQKKFRVE